MFNKILANLVVGLTLLQQFPYLLPPTRTGFRVAHFERYVLAHRAIQVLGDSVYIVVRHHRGWRAALRGNPPRLPREEQQHSERCEEGVDVFSLGSLSSR